MPNWCCTDSYFVGSKEDVYAFYIDFTKAQKVIKAGDTGWLGRLVHYNGDQDSIKDENGNFRGFYETMDEPFQLDDNNYAVNLYSCDAWYVADGFYRYVCEKYDLDHYYYAEEPGCSIYETNDIEGKFFDFRYILNVYDADIDELVNKLELENADEKVIKFVRTIASLNDIIFKDQNEIEKTFGMPFNEITKIIDDSKYELAYHFDLIQIDIVG